MTSLSYHRRRRFVSVRAQTNRRRFPGGPRMLRTVSLALAAIAILFTAVDANAQRQVARGRYLANLGGCNDCHTPGYFFGKPDMARFLGGSEVGFEIPGLGVFHGPTLK